MTKRRHEFTLEETTELLNELDTRLRQRGIAASIFVVGGAAIAANQTRRARITEDVDGLTRHTVVLDEAKQLARERGLSEDWLNPNAGMWMPPLPKGVLDQPAEPGLRVTYADEGFLFATKLIAQRTKDAEDVVALAGRLGMQSANPEQLEAHIRSYYTDPAMLEFIVSGDDVDRELGLLARDASRMLHRRTAPNATDVDPPAAPARLDTGTDRLRRSTHLEQRTPPPTGGGSPHSPGVGPH